MKCDWQWEVSASFYALISVLLFFDEQNIVPWALFACSLHEMGHLMAIYTLGGKVSVIRLSLVGAEIIPNRNTLFSYVEEILIILAGPLTNISVFVWFGFLKAVSKRKATPILWTEFDVGTLQFVASCFA